MAAGGGEDVLFNALASLIEGLPSSGATSATLPAASPPSSALPSDGNEHEGGGGAATAALPSTLPPSSTPPGNSVEPEGAGGAAVPALSGAAGEEPGGPETATPSSAGPASSGQRPPGGPETATPSSAGLASSGQRPPGGPPTLGPTAAAADVRGAARRRLAEIRGPRTATARLGPPPRDRRLLWLRWLGALRGAAPREWLEEVRAQREDFGRLLQGLEKRRGGDEAFEQLLSDVDLDVGRCFPEVPCLQGPEAQAALTQVLLAYVERRRERAEVGEAEGWVGYRQGLHELAAACLVVCWRGSWPAPPATLDPTGLGVRRQGELGRGPAPAPAAAEALEDEGDLEVYAELACPEAAPADALAMLEGLLHGRLLAEMYETATAPGQASAAALRCQHVVSALSRLDPILAARINGWGIEPHVLMLRWMRLLFLRELPFVEALGLWDALFADAAVSAAGPPPLLPAGTAAPASSAALPLADALAIAMILTAQPTSPAQLLRFDERPADWRRLLSSALELRGRGSGASAAELRRQAPQEPHERPAASLGGGRFPQPPQARYDGTASLLLAPRAEAGLGAMSGERTQQALKVATAGVSACGHVLGWAGSALNLAMQDVLTVVADGGYGPQGAHGCLGPVRLQDGEAGEDEQPADAPPPGSPMEASPPGGRREPRPGRRLEAPSTTAAASSAPAEASGEPAAPPPPQWDPRAPFPIGRLAGGEAAAPAAPAACAAAPLPAPAPAAAAAPAGAAAAAGPRRVARQAPRSAPEPEPFRPAPREAEGTSRGLPSGLLPTYESLEPAVDLKGRDRLLAPEPAPLLPPGSYEGAVDVKALAARGLPWPEAPADCGQAPGRGFSPPGPTVAQQLAGAIGSLQQGAPADPALLQQLREARAQLLAAAAPAPPPAGLATQGCPQGPWG